MRNPDIMETNDPATDMALAGISSEEQGDLPMASRSAGIPEQTSATSLRSGYTWKHSRARYMYSDDSLTRHLGASTPSAADARECMRSVMRSWSSSIASSAVSVRLGVLSSPREDTMQDTMAPFILT